MPRAIYGKNWDRNYDYVQEKRAKKKISLSHFFISSGIFIAVGVVFAVIHG